MDGTLGDRRIGTAIIQVRDKSYNVYPYLQYQDFNVHTCSQVKRRILGLYCPRGLLL
jgi:hypothetical protein